MLLQVMLGSDSNNLSTDKGKDKMISLLKRWRWRLVAIKSLKNYIPTTEKRWVHFGSKNRPFWFLI